MSTITDFYVFRHSQTHRNLKGTEIQGWIEDEEAQINEEGIQGALKLEEGLTQLVPDPVAIYSSDLNRAMHTAEFVQIFYQDLQKEIPIIKDGRLREKCYGKWDTLSPEIRNEHCRNYYYTHREELRAQNDRFAKWKIEPLSSGDIEPKLPNCQDKLESIYTVFERGKAFFAEMGEKHKGGKVLVSSHDAFNVIMATEADYRQRRDDSILPVFFEKKSRQFPENCAAYHFTWDSEKQELNFAGEIALQ